MIISDRYRFVFVHIPKCAGTFVRKKLDVFDDTNGFFARRHQHESLGLIDYFHLPLTILRDHFPADFERVAAYESFAVLRDPFDRFPSSVSQRLSFYKRSPINTLSARALAREVDDAIHRLTHDGPGISPEYIHFYPQIGFVECDGREVVSRLYTVDQITEMLEDIGRLVDRDLVGQGEEDIKPRNQALVFRNAGLRVAVEKMRPALGRLVSASLPDSAKIVLRRLVYVPRRERTPQIFTSAHVRDFVREYYRRDLELFAATAARAGAGRLPVATQPDHRYSAEAMCAETTDAR
jgi:hypothetical protein